MSARRFSDVFKIIAAILVVAYGVSEIGCFVGKASSTSLKENQFLIGYLATTSLFIAFPNRRRTDVTLMLVIVLQLWTLALFCWLAMAPGAIWSTVLPESCIFILAAMAAAAPGELEQLRLACRKHPFAPMRQALTAVGNRRVSVKRKRLAAPAASV